MNKSELILKIKNQLKSLVEQKFAQIKAGDLMITSPDDVLILGSEVYSPDAEGNNVPLADGEYTLDSGELITVVGGKVSALESKTEEGGETTEEAGETEMAKVEEPAKEEAPGQTEEMTKMMERLAAVEKKMEDMVAKYEEMAKEKVKMEQEFSKIAAQPSVDPIVPANAEFKSVDVKKSGLDGVDMASIRERVRKNR